MDIASIPDLSLAECLSLVEQHFDAPSIASRTIDQASVLEYFHQSDRGYRLFHSQEGAMHVVLNCNERFTTDGYLAQIELIAEQLAKLCVSNVLEIGCGTGFNTSRLAARMPDVNFVGLDLSTSHVETAIREARGLKNLRYHVGDFHGMKLEDSLFDAVYAIECLCQGNDIRQSLREAHRILRPGGLFVVIDVFRQMPLETYDEQIQFAARLVEKTMAVDEFAVINLWVEEVRVIGFELLQQTDLSDQISHNVARFYSLVRRFFRMPRAAKAFLRAFPPRLLENAVSGLLMPFTVGSGAQAYYYCVLKRPEKIEP